MTDAVEQFEPHRPVLLGLAWRMLGSLSAAEDVVQDAWLRFAKSSGVRSPRAWLLRVVARLCLDQSSRASARREVPAGDALPEPVATPHDLELADTVSMAFLVVLRTLSPAERAVFLLHEVFDHSHAQIGGILDRTPASCRQLLRRAKVRIQDERHRFSASREEHVALLGAFARACREGDLDRLTSLLASDAQLVADPRAETFGRLRAVRRPLRGADVVARFLLAAMTHGPSDLSIEVRDLNGQPALWAEEPGKPPAVVQIGAGSGLVHHIFVVTDPRASAGS